MRLPTLFITVMTFILSTALSAQTYDWEWAERGGGKRNIGTGSSVPYYRDYENILDIKVDSNNNYYYLAQIGNDQTTYGNMPITTYDDGNSERDIYLFSTDAQGNFRFDKVIGGGIWSDKARSLGIDAQDNIYISGSAPATIISSNQGTHTPVHFDNDTIMNIGSFDTPLPANKSLYTVKYDSNGNFEWLRQPQSPNLTLNDVFPVTKHFDSDVAADGTLHWFFRIGPGSHLDGDLVVPDSNTEGQAVIIRYDTNGNYLSYIPLDFEIDGFNGFNISLDYDPVNDRYYLAAHQVVGNSSLSFNGVSSPGSILLALDAVSGNLIWREDNTGNSSFWINDVVIDDQGDIYITGQSQNSNGSTNDGESFVGYVFDQADNNGTGTNAPYILKLNSQGNLLWGNNTSSFSDHSGRSISFYGNEVAIGLGLWNGTTWDGYSVGGSGYEASLVRFNKNTGAVIALEKVSSGSGNAEITALEADQQGNYVVGGFTESSLFVDNSNIPTLTKTGGEADFFTAKYACQGCSIGTEQPEDKEAIVLYPNPAQSYFKLESRHQLNNYRIYDMQGKKVQQGKITQAKQSITISDLPNGVYFVKVSDRHQQQQVLRLVVK